MKKFLKIIGVLIGIPLMLYIIFIISTIIIGSYGMKHEMSKIIVWLFMEQLLLLNLYV